MILVALLTLNVETIGSRFGGIPQSLPAFAWPDISLETSTWVVGWMVPVACTSMIKSVRAAGVV